MAHTLYLLILSTSCNLGWDGRHFRIPPCLNLLITWSIRGINGNVKREKLVDVFRKGKLLALSEAKLKGNFDRCCGVGYVVSLLVFWRLKGLEKVWLTY